MKSFDIKSISEEISTPIQDWENRCCDICCLLLKYNLVEGKLLDGFYVGKIHKDSIFLNNGNIDKLRHCWIQMKNGFILDPTIWTITCEKPYIFVGESDAYVDGIEYPLSFYGY